LNLLAAGGTDSEPPPRVPPFPRFFLALPRISGVAPVVVLFAATRIATAHTEHTSARRPDANDTYTITSTLRLVPPFNYEDMTDAFQDARVVERGADVCTVEITYYPLFRAAIGENPRWREQSASMTEFLRPTPSENWDETMRRDVLAELSTAGIDPERLTDKQLVERVARWAMQRAKSTPAFAVWTVHFPDGKPAVFPALRGAFDRQRRDPAWSDEQMIEQEALGRSMFYQKVHGSCTSSSVYLTTILRALGIPTRIVFCIPPFDANDPAQAEMFYGAIRHHQVRETGRRSMGCAGLPTICSTKSMSADNGCGSITRTSASRCWMGATSDCSRTF
jgi:hypothetical protein